MAIEDFQPALRTSSYLGCRESSLRNSTAKLTPAHWNLSAETYAVRSVAIYIKMQMPCIVG